MDEQEIENIRRAMDSMSEVVDETIHNYDMSNVATNTPENPDVEKSLEEEIILLYRSRGKELQRNEEGLLIAEWKELLYEYKAKYACHTLYSFNQVEGKLEENYFLSKKRGVQQYITHRVYRNDEKTITIVEGDAFRFWMDGAVVFSRGVIRPLKSDTILKINDDIYLIKVGYASTMELAAMLFNTSVFYVTTKGGDENRNKYFLLNEEEYQAELRNLVIRKRLESLKHARNLRENKERLKELGKVMSQVGERAYPGLWEVVVESRLVTLTIHFPIVHMTNSDNDKHVMKDMYIHLSADPSGRFVGKVKGERATVTLQEYLAKFTHSHLPFTDTLAKSAFCMSDNNIEILSSDIRRVAYFDKPTYWIRRFEAIVFQMNDYLAWESIEGSRYCYINHVGAVNSEGVRINIDSEASRILEKIREQNAPLPPMSYVYGTGFVVEDTTDEFENWLLPYAITKQIKLADGSFVRISENKNNTKSFIPPNSSTITFKGQTIRKYVQVPEANQDEESINKARKYCDRAVKEKVVDYINKKLHEIFREKCLRTEFRREQELAKKTPFYNTFNGRSEAYNKQYSFLQALPIVSDVPGPGVVSNPILQDGGGPGQHLTNEF